MPRKKAAYQADIRPWLSARNDCREGRFLQIGNSLLLSRAFQNLTANARFLYLCLAMEAGGKRDVIISRSHAQKYGVKQSTFSRSIKELSESGFIRIDESRGRYETNRFEFISDWKIKTLYQNDTS